MRRIAEIIDGVIAGVVDGIVNGVDSVSEGSSVIHPWTFFRSDRTRNEGNIIWDISNEEIPGEDKANSEDGNTNENFHTQHISAIAGVIINIFRFCFVPC